MNSIQLDKMARMHARRLRAMHRLQIEVAPFVSGFVEVRGYRNEDGTYMTERFHLSEFNDHAIVRHYDIDFNTRQTESVFRTKWGEFSDIVRKQYINTAEGKDDGQDG